MVRSLLDLIEDNTGGLPDPEDADKRSYNGHGKHDPVVRDRKEENIIVFDTF